MRLSFRISTETRSNRPSALTKALSLGPREWIDLAVASLALGVARLRIAFNRARLFPLNAAISSGRKNRDEHVERVRVAIVRASSRLPWRSDCLVQALAARSWLHRLGVETSLCIGVPEEQRERFEAHAWLMHGKTVITGGDISAYIPLLDSGTGIKLNESSKI